MKFVFEKKNINILDLFRNAGYSYRGVVEGDMSFIKRVGYNEYPHYHIYAKDLGKEISLNMHLDQKRPSYSGASAHSGEYNGDLVEKEMERVKEVIKSLNR
jgi:hypothetical protein